MLKKEITAIILSGGKSTRMNKKDKGLMLLKGKPLYLWVVDKIKNQVDHIIINSNQNYSTYKQANYPIFKDILPNHLGPLAGIHSGLIHSTTNWNLIVSCDTPFLPNDLVHRLFEHIGNNLIAYVFDGEREHPTLMLLHKDVSKEIKKYLNLGERKLLIFLKQLNAVKVDFSDQKQAFININTLDELLFWQQK